MGIVLEDGSGVAVDWVNGRSYFSARRRLNIQSGQRKGRKGVAGSGWVHGAGRGKTARGWKGVRPGVRLKSRTVRASEEPEEYKREFYHG